MIMDHVGLTVGDYEKSKRFYASALAPLGIELVTEFGGWAGFGKGGKPESARSITLIILAPL
jgi:catechol 2,3-dioxygenase-like lactoylglutathione lyase family enzyme